MPTPRLTIEPSSTSVCGKESMIAKSFAPIAGEGSPGSDPAPSFSGPVVLCQTNVKLFASPVMN